MRLHYKTLLLPPLVLIGVACGRSGSQEIDQLRWLDNADGLNDAKAALAKGDHRLLAVRGLSISIPMVDQKDFEEHKAKFGIREIEGTTDALINREHERLNRKAMVYALTYNATILHYYKP